MIEFSHIKAALSSLTQNYFTVVFSGRCLLTLSDMMLELMVNNFFFIFFNNSELSLEMFLFWPESFSKSNGW